MVADCGDLYKVFKTFFSSSIGVWTLKGRSGGGDGDDDDDGGGDGNDGDGRDGEL